MDYRSRLYPSVFNPLLMEPERPLPSRAAIIGAGTIGPDIGYYLKSAIPGVELVFVDVAETALKNAGERIAGYVAKAVKKRKMDEETGKAVLEDISYTTDYSAIKGSDLVIEAATENPSLKRRIFKQVEEIVDRDTIITSNTSSIPADRIFSGMERPSRATVTHFFAPAWRNPCVEVITWEKADRDIVDYLLWMFVKTGKAPIVSDNAICFILDRVFDNWCNESAFLLRDATAGQVDAVAGEFVFAGPFFVLNMANGNPIIIETNTLQMEEGEHYRPAGIFNSVDRWNTIRMGESLDVPDEVKQEVRDRLLGILFSQSFDIINRGIGTPEDLNLGCLMALGFKKGTMDIMGGLGEAETLRIMEKFQVDRPGFPGPEKAFSYYQGFRRHLLTDVKDGVKIITIRRPQAMNALNDEVNDEIMAVISGDGDNPDIKGFIITGYGERAFCAGADIGNFPGMLGDFDASVQYARDCSKLLACLDAMEKPVVAAMNGMALGGGMELALRCHGIVATGNAYFQFPEITLGILPGIGGCVVPYRKWPGSWEIFHTMIRSGSLLTIQKAKEMGMVADICSTYPDMIRRAVQEVNALQGKISPISDKKADIGEIPQWENPMAGKLHLSRQAVSILDKTIMAAASAPTFQEALELGYRGFGEIACTPAAREGISAFLERRKPDFSDK